jgi:GT2 family glycosyltransferase
MPASSIVVPSYARPEALRACLAALAAQDDPDREVVVVDDGSTEPLAPVCAAFEGVRCIRQENAGPAAARNRGAREARGTFLAFTDDDCRPRSDWLSALRRAWGGDERRMVGGRVVNGLPRNPYASASQALCDYLYHYYGAASGEAPFFTTNNCGVSREGFEALGGFDETFPLAAAEDRDLGMRWRDRGGSLAYAPEAVVDHHHALTLRRFLRQHANYGRGARHLHLVLDARGAEQPKVEPPRFYAGLLLWPLRRRGVAGLGGTVLMGLSQVAMVRGYAAARASERRP